MNIIDKIDKTLNEKASVSDADLQKIGMLTARNNHQENYYFIAKSILKNKKLAKIFKSIMDIRDTEGHMDSNLSAYSTSKFLEMRALLKQELSPEDYKAIYDRT